MIACGDRPNSSWAYSGRIPWMMDDVETTALVLLALSRGRPESPLAAQAAEFLLGRKGCYGIRPAKARGYVVAASAVTGPGAVARQPID